MPSARIPALILALGMAVRSGAAADSNGRFAPPPPLYVGKPIIGDYRLNQALESAVRWTSLGFILGGFAASALYPEDQLGIMAMVGTVAGSALGFSAGAAAGYLRGRDWERRRTRGEAVPVRRRQVGYELDFGQGMSGRPNDRDYVHFALAWRLPGHRRHAPDEYQVTIGSQSWDSGDRSESHAHEDRHGFRILKYFRDELVNPCLGLGAGYSRGTAFDYSLVSPIEAEGIPFTSAFAEALAGVEINAFGFFHARVLAAYEPFGPFRRISRHGEYHPLSTISMGASIGARIF